MKWTCTSTFQMTGITLELYYQFHYRNEENDPPGKPPVTERGYRCAVQLWSSKDGRIKYSESASIEEDGRGHISFPSVEPGGYSVLVALSSDIQPKLFCAENHISISPILKYHWQFLDNPRSDSVSRILVKVESNVPLSSFGTFLQQSRMQFWLQACSTTGGYFGSFPMEITEMEDGTWGNIVPAPLLGSPWHDPGSCWHITIWETRADLDSYQCVEVREAGLQAQADGLDKHDLSPEPVPCTSGSITVAAE